MGEIIGELGKKEIREQRSWNERLTGERRNYFELRVLTRPAKGSSRARIPQELVNDTIFGLYLREEQDEFQRDLWVRSMIWGIGSTLTVITFWGALVEFGLANGLKLMFVFPMFTLITCAARWVLKLRYR